jgi:hypothetical protein
VKHPLLQQTLPSPHWLPPTVHATQVWVVVLQIGVGLAQSVFAQQIPVKHCPVQQTLPSPHWALVVQTLQVCSMQIGFSAGHVSLAQQSPVKHVPPQQTLPEPH